MERYLQMQGLKQVVRLRCGILTPEFFQDWLNTHVSRAATGRGIKLCPSHLSQELVWVMDWLSEYMSGPKRLDLKLTFQSYSSIEDGSPFFISHQPILICFMDQVELCLLVIIQNTNINPLID